MVFFLNYECIKAGRGSCVSVCVWGKKEILVAQNHIGCQVLGELSSAKREEKEKSRSNFGVSPSGNADRSEVHRERNCGGKKLAPGSDAG